MRLAVFKAVGVSAATRLLDAGRAGAWPPCPTAGLLDVARACIAASWGTRWGRDVAPSTRPRRPLRRSRRLAASPAFAPRGVAAVAPWTGGPSDRGVGLAATLAECCVRQKNDSLVRPQVRVKPLLVDGLIVLYGNVVVPATSLSVMRAVQSNRLLNLSHFSA